MKPTGRATPPLTARRGGPGAKRAPRPRTNGCRVPAPGPAIPATDERPAAADGFMRGPRERPPRGAGERAPYSRTAGVRAIRAPRSLAGGTPPCVPAYGYVAPARGASDAGL